MNMLAGALAAAALLTTGPALAQHYPDRPIKVVVTTVPGPLDAFARAIVNQMSQRLKQPMVIENKPGAGGNVGTDFVAKAPADGYTLLFALDTTFTVNPSLYEKMPFDVSRDFAVIGVPVTYSQMLAVGPNVKANNLSEFLKLAKTSKMAYASGGNGSPSHLTMAAFLGATGTEMTHIPYKGTGASVVDVMSGQVDSVFAVTSGIWPQAKAGKLKALAVSGIQRSPSAPDVPTVAELGYPQFNATFAYVLAAPANTPKEIQQMLARELAAAMKTPEVMEFNRTADYAATDMGPEASATWLRETRKRWNNVVVSAKITN
jgi:tripartite-type tricarboxylate transporter receptor subunit TctC